MFFLVQLVFICLFNVFYRFFFLWCSMVFHWGQKMKIEINRKWWWSMLPMKNNPSSKKICKQKRKQRETTCNSHCHSHSHIISYHGPLSLVLCLYALLIAVVIHGPLVTVACEASTGTRENGRGGLGHDPAEAAMGNAHLTIRLDPWLRWFPVLENPKFVSSETDKPQKKLQTWTNLFEPKSRCFNMFQPKEPR